MNILIFNTNNPYKESGVVALDLFNQLKSRGHEVKLIVRSFNKNYHEGIINAESCTSAWWKSLIAKYEWRINLFKKILRLKDRTPVNSDYCFFQLNTRKLVYKTDKLLRKADTKPDIIIILYAKKFLTARNIYELYIKTSAKIFWLMYDMAPFTGGCHYAWKCKGYQKNCGNCPGLYSSDPFDISYQNLLYNKNYVEKTNIQIIAGSEWQYSQAIMSTLFKNKQIHKILIPVDSSVFKPVDKRRLRKQMKIPENKKIIFFGAVGLTERRKGIRYLIDSLKYLKERIKVTDSDLEEDILLLVAGQSFDGIVDFLPFEFRYLGYLDNLHKIASAYQAADVFICPSIEDSGPTMINQSIMSGTPVVSFDMGVSLDLVITGETGYKAKLEDSNDMAQGIYSILKLNLEDYNKLSQRCRDLALKLISPEVRIEILEDIITNTKSD